MPRGIPKKSESETLTKNSTFQETSTVSYDELNKKYLKLLEEHELLKKRFRTARKHMAEKGI